MNDVERMLEQKNAVDKKLNRLKREMAAIKANAYQNNKFVAPDYYRARTREIDKLKAESQRLQLEVGKAKRPPNWEHNVLLESFIDIARERLAREDFAGIMDAAKARASNESSSAA